MLSEHYKDSKWLSMVHINLESWKNNYIDFEHINQYLHHFICKKSSVHYNYNI